MVLDAVSNMSSAFEYAAEELKRDRGFLIQLVSKVPLLLHDLPDIYRADKQMILSAISRKRSGWLEMMGP